MTIYTYVEMVTNFGVRLKFSIVRTAPVTTNKSPMLVLDRVLLGHIRIDDGPQVWVRGQVGGDNSRRRRRLNGNCC